MAQSIFRKESIFPISADIQRNVGVLLALFISIVGLTIIQDFLESNRSGYSFYFSESILFKTIWILFIPILALLGRILKNQTLDSLGKTTFFIAIPILIHLVILPFVFLFLSVLFYNGRYDIYKILTYTLANDLYKLAIIYSVFVFGYKYLSFKSTDLVCANKKSCLRKIIIGNGKHNTVVEVKDIYHISAETPYISFQLEEKKHLHPETLKSISAQLDKRIFVRIHKSTIVNLDKVESFRSRLNGDYDIFLKNGVELRLSRTYAANFKSNFKNPYPVRT